MINCEEFLFSNKDYDNSKFDAQINANLYLNEDNYWRLDRDMTRVFGKDAAVWLTYLISHGGWVIKNKQAQKIDLFYCDQKIILWNTGIALDKQTQLIKDFKLLGVMRVERFKSPPQNHYGINMAYLNALVKKLAEFDDALFKDNERIKEVNKNIKLEDRTEKEHTKFYILDELSEVSKTEIPVFKDFDTSLSIINKIISNYSIVLPKGNTAPAVPQNSVSSIKATPTTNNSTYATQVKLRRRTATTLSTPATQPAAATKNRTNPYEASIREIIKHWNSKPAVKKLTIPKNGNPPKGIYTKVVTRYLPKLLAQEGYGTSKIKTAIDVYNNLLSDKFNYLLRDSVHNHRVSFDIFLNGLTNKMKDRVYPNNPVGKNVVWLNECMKPQSYLDKKYGLIKDDDFPEWTKEFEDMLLRPNQRTSNGTSPYAEGEYEEIRFQGSLIMMKNGLSIADRNLLIDASKRLNQFLDVYGVGKGGGSPIRWMKDDPKILWVKLLFRAISSSIGPEYEPSLTYLVSAKTYEELLPKFLKDQFMMSKGFPPKEMPWKDYRLKHGK